MNNPYTIGRSEHKMPPQTTGADTLGVTINALLICTRVIVTQKIDAKSELNPISLTQFGAFHAAIRTPIRKSVSMAIGPDPPIKK